MSRVNRELFQLVEQSGDTGITAKEMAEHTGMQLNTVRGWCSRWTKEKFLKRLPPPDHEWKMERGRPECRYVLGNKEWSVFLNRESFRG